MQKAFLCDLVRDAHRLMQVETADCPIGAFEQFVVVLKKIYRVTLVIKKVHKDLLDFKWVAARLHKKFVVCDERKRK